MRLLLILLFWCFGCSVIYAQKTLVFGRVTETKAGSPVAFANVYFIDTNTGTYSDELGNFLLETTEKVDSFALSALGYKDTVIAIQKGIQQEVNVKLVAQDYELSEVVVTVGENPAFEILRNVVANKQYNNPEQYDTYQYRSYNKIQFDLNNFTDKIKKNFLFRPFPFVWEYQDSMPNGVRYLPFLFKENVRQHYYRKSPKGYKEYVLGKQNAQFFRGKNIEKFIEELYLNPNIYENSVIILKKSFPSPIHDRFKRYYNYTLADTLTYLDGLPCYHIHFSPKGYGSVAFNGDMYIHDTTYAVKRIDLNFSIEANVNFVRSFWLRMDYDWIDKQNWFIKENTVLADFTVVENSPELTGFFGRRFSEYKEIVLNQPIDKDRFNPVETFIETESMDEKDEQFWAMERSDTLMREEKDIFHLVDTIQRSPRFKLIKKVVEVISTGWFPLNGFDIGEVTSLYSFNDIEGSRLRVGLRTSPKSTFPLSAQGYLAYGTRDERWKYMGELNLRLSNSFGKHTLIGARYRQDVDQLGRSYTAIPIDHFLTYLLQIAPFDDRTFVEDQSVYVERQWFLGFVTRLSVFRQNVQPFGEYNFYKKSDASADEVVSGFRMGGLTFSGRFAFGQHDISAQFYDKDNIFFMIRYPVVSFELTYGKKGVLDSDFDYRRARLRVEHQQRVGRIGYLSYLIEGGKVWGEVPYPFLAIPFGSQSVLANRASFNMMNFLEFASDEYLAVHLEHHFEGILFNKIPGIRKLKLRFFLLARLFMGNLSSVNNEATWRFPEGLYPIEHPYGEVGFGIENILKLGRIDFTWRLAYRDHPDTYFFLPKPSFQVRF